jgi:TolB-like protein
MILLKRYVLSGMLCILAFASGCGGSKVPTYHVSQDVDFSYIKKVAVLPFENLTNERSAGEVVRDVVVSELLAPGLADVVLPGEVASAVDKMGIRAGQTLNAEQLKTLGKTLNVQAFILGTVLKFGETRTGSVSVPEVSITLMMADAASGSIIWSVTKTTSGAGFMAAHFGAKYDTMSESVLKLVREALGTLPK